MKMMKSVSCLMLCLAILVSSGMAMTLAPPSQWAQEDVNAAIAADLVPPDLRHNYTQPITRAEFSALAVRLYETVKGEITGRVPFADTNDINVQKMAYLEVVAGVGNNRFDPNGTLTRQQAAVMLTRLAAAMRHPFPVGNLRQAAPFADMGSVAPWAVEGVTRVYAAEIMGGVGNNNFAPHLPYTREQSIVTMLRMYEMVNASHVSLPYTPGNVMLPGIEGEPSYEVGGVIIVANDVAHEPYVHFFHSATRYVSVSGLPFSPEAAAQQLQEIPLTNSLQIFVEGDYAHSVSFSLYDETFNLIYEGKDSFVLPAEAGVFLLCIDIMWRNETSQYGEATWMRYVFMIRI